MTGSVASSSVGGQYTRSGIGPAGPSMVRSSVRASGWTGLLEDLCAPANELEFNRLIRDPAGTGKPAEPGERR